MFIFMFLIPVLVIWAIVAGSRGNFWFGGPSPSQNDRPETAVELLKKRYARGDISKEEFEEKKRALA